MSNCCINVGSSIDRRICPELFIFSNHGTISPLSRSLGKLICLIDTETPSRPSCNVISTGLTGILHFDFPNCRKFTSDFLSVQRLSQLLDCMFFSTVGGNPKAPNWVSSNPFLRLFSLLQSRLAPKSPWVYGFLILLMIDRPQPSRSEHTSSHENSSSMDFVHPNCYFDGWQTESAD